MKIKINTMYLAIAAVAISCFALSPMLQAQQTNTALGNKALDSNTTGVGNTAIGFSAMTTNTTGSQNTATGRSALLNNTTGSFNTATGVQALVSNTTGELNTATGVDALFNNTTGSANTATGRSALFGNTTGRVNTATGSQTLFKNTTGTGNTATGVLALYTNSTGDDNTATGSAALNFNTSGSNNTATGYLALWHNAIGDNNTATGNAALKENTTGSFNTAAGFNALAVNTSGERNTATGYGALGNNKTGSFNVALGAGAGSGVTAANDVICIGRAVAGADVNNTCFIGNIHGVQTQNGNALPVVIDGAGQLGTAPSSERYKHDIKPMDKASEGVLALNPVTFHYKTDKTNTPQFGLIAEEVERVNPDLVVRDAEGKVYTVRYEAVNAMLLNEFLKEHKIVQEQGAMISQQQKQIDALTAVVQKVSAQLELNKSTPRTVCLPTVALREGGNNQ
jgi:hypothetical protein